MSNLLVPPPPLRSRASSTNLRPALTLATLGSRPKSCQDAENEVPFTPPPDLSSHPCKSSSPLPSSSAFSSLVDKCVGLVRSRTFTPSLAPPTPSISERSSFDDATLVPSSATTTVDSHTFDEQETLFNEKSLFQNERPRSWLRGAPSVHAPLLFVLISFPLSTAVVFSAFWSLPFEFAWPQNLTDLAQLGRDLRGYSNSGPVELAHVLGVLSVATIWMHAWSVPGSVLWNVLAGVLFSPIRATLILSVLTTLGSLCATLLSAPIAPFITHYFPKSLAVVRSAFEGDSARSETPVWIRVTVLRLVGIVPWSGVNIACGVIGVSLWDCLLGTFIGSIPWTAVTCQIGDIVHTVVATPSPNPETISSILMSPALIAKLVALSALSLAPILGRNYLRLWLSPSPAVTAAEEFDAEERVTRWTWVRDWRTKVRLATRSRSPSGTVEDELATVRHEKEASLS